jgi:hypothetical protein
MNRPGISVLATPVVAAGTQLIQPQQRDAPVPGDISSPNDVYDNLDRSCDDCHPSHPRWPWYRCIAPASWLVTADVHEGRKHWNFSEWPPLSTKEQAEKLDKICGDVDEREIPPWFYFPMHPEARLSAANRSTLKAWVQSADATARNEDD